MNMGKRIKELIDSRGWKQVDLLARVPELDSGTLSALITRDSRFSEHALSIAKAFGVSLDYLVFGVEGSATSQSPAAGYNLEATAVCELLTLYAALDEAGRSFLLDAARARLQHSSAANQRKRHT